MSVNYVEADRSTHWALVRPAHAADDDATLDAVDLDVLRGFEEVQLEGEPDLIIELIDAYLEDAPLKLASMREAVAWADGAALRGAAHSLKGSSASLGVGRIAVLCEELERVQHTDWLGEAAALLDRMGQELERARRAFEDERRRRA